MASGTVDITLVPGAAPVRIDDTAAYVSGAIFGGSGKIFYVAGTSAPTGAALNQGFQIDDDGSISEPFNIAMGSGDSLWAVGEGRLSLMRRQV